MLNTAVTTRGLLAAGVWMRADGDGELASIASCGIDKGCDVAVGVTVDDLHRVRFRTVAGDEVLVIGVGVVGERGDTTFRSPVR